MNRRTLTVILVLLAVLVLGISASGAAAQSSYAMWFASYWDNPTMTGAPAYTRSEGNIDHNWGSGSPSLLIQPDTWSAQFTSYVDFAAGTYRFTVTSDDGVRVYLGDKHIITDWSKHAARTSVATVSLRGGRYNMAVDYYDEAGGAQLKLGWERIGAAATNLPDVAIIASGPAAPPAVPPTTDWRGEYFNNVNLSGVPAVIRTDAAINFDWVYGAPVTGLQADNFSVRWTGSPYLSAGTYRFSVTTDDGVRLWVNNQLVIDRWVDRAATTNTADVTLPGGAVPIRMEYYDHSLKAQASLSWALVGTSGTGGPASAYVNTSYLNMRSGPGVGFSIIAALPRYTPVTLIGRNASATWVKVIIPDGRQGWMNVSYLATTYPVGTLPVAG
jgi:hypothetical protein